MNTISQLKQMRQEMYEELAKLPEYRAAQAMKKFIDEMTEIYGRTEASVPDNAHPAPTAIEKRIVEGPVANGVAQRIRAYSP
ncbi:MAG: hypothetical protein ACR650_03475 [Methylocystis sp.]|jgi:hypothetical protein